MAGYIIGLILGVLIFVLQNLKPTSSWFRVLYLILTVAFLWGISYANAGYWNILIIPLGEIVLCLIAAIVFPYSGKSASNEYLAINGRNYYEELNDNDKIGRIEAPGVKQTYDRIIVGIIGQITNNKDDLIRFGNLLYSKNFYPISKHTKKEIVLHIHSVIEEVSKSSKNSVMFMQKAMGSIEQLFNAYVSVMSIHEEATRNIEDIKKVK